MACELELDLNTTKPWIDELSLIYDISNEEGLVEASDNLFLTKQNAAIYYCKEVFRKLFSSNDCYPPSTNDNSTSSSTFISTSSSSSSSLPTIESPKHLPCYVSSKIPPALFQGPNDTNFFIIGDDIPDVHFPKGTSRKTKWKRSGNLVDRTPQGWNEYTFAYQTIIGSVVDQVVSDNTNDTSIKQTQPKPKVKAKPKSKGPKTSPKKEKDKDLRSHVMRVSTIYDKTMSKHLPIYFVEIRYRPDDGTRLGRDESSGKEVVTAEDIERATKVEEVLYKNHDYIFQPLPESILSKNIKAHHVEVDDETEGEVEEETEGEGEELDHNLSARELVDTNNLNQACENVMKSIAAFGHALQTSLKSNNNIATNKAISAFSNTMLALVNTNNLPTVNNKASSIFGRQGSGLSITINDTGNLSEPILLSSRSTYSSLSSSGVSPLNVDNNNNRSTNSHYTPPRGTPNNSTVAKVLTASIDDVPVVLSPNKRNRSKSRNSGNDENIDDSYRNTNHSRNSKTPRSNSRSGSAQIRPKSATRDRANTAPSVSHNSTMKETPRSRLNSEGNYDSDIVSTPLSVLSENVTMDNTSRMSTTVSQPGITLPKVMYAEKPATSVPIKSSAPSDFSGLNVLMHKNSNNHKKDNNNNNNNSYDDIIYPQPLQGKSSNTTYNAGSFISSMSISRTLSHANFNPLSISSKSWISSNTNNFNSSYESTSNENLYPTSHGIIDSLNSSMDSTKENIPTIVVPTKVIHYPSIISTNNNNAITMDENIFDFSHSPKSIRDTTFSNSTIAVSNTIYPKNTTSLPYVDSSSQNTLVTSDLPMPPVLHNMLDDINFPLSNTIHGYHHYSSPSTNNFNIPVPDDLDDDMFFNPTTQHP